jgi:DNA/RNA endonuclease YhcR with UshA esterase domain
MKPMLVVAQCVLLGAFAFAQQKLPAAPADPSTPKYDVNQETKIAGVVKAISDYDCAISGTKGAHITIKTDNQIVEVHLAPAKFLQEFGVTFAEGDAVLITGTRSEWHGTTAVLARQVERGVNTFTFRDERGQPIW